MGVEAGAFNKALYLEIVGDKKPDLIRAQEHTVKGVCLDQLGF